MIQNPQKDNYWCSKQNTKFFESLKIDLKNKLIIFVIDTIPFSNHRSKGSASFATCAERKFVLEP